MEIAAETKAQFEEFLKAEGFDERLLALLEQAELAMNRGETFDGQTAEYRRILKSYIECYRDTVVRFATKMAAQKIIQLTLQGPKWKI